MTPEKAAELIAWLTADVSSWNEAIIEFEALKREDIVLALAMVKSVPAQLVARIKHADETKYSGLLVDELLSAIERGALVKVVTNVIMPQQWKYPAPDFLRNMCRLAIAEMISPRMCPTCCGRRTIGGTRRNHKVRDCNRCNKTGRVAYKESDRAAVMGLTRHAWGMTWKDRYQSIQCLLDHYDSVACGGIAKRLSRA